MKILRISEAVDTREPMEITKAVLALLDSKQVVVPLLEIDGQRDSLFVTVRKKDHLSGIYMAIDLDVDTGFYEVSISDRSHSGGDPTFQSFSFVDTELTSNLPKIANLYLNAPRY